MMVDESERKEARDGREAEIGTYGIEAVAGFLADGSPCCGSRSVRRDVDIFLYETNVFARECI
jgi:hypothetical protein